MSYYAEALIYAQGVEKCFSGQVEEGQELEFLKSQATPRHAHKIFDLASLTKVIVTSVLLVDEAQNDGALELNDWAAEQLLSDAIMSLKGGPLEKVTLLDLWEHRSGLPPIVEVAPDRPFFYRLSERPEAWRAVLQQILFMEEDFKEAGDTEYSDIGFLLLGAWLEHKYSQRLDELWMNWQARHQVKDSFPHYFLDNHPTSLNEVIPTESRHGSGVVNDDRAYYLGGVAPHAGLFGSVLDVKNFCEHLLSLANSHTLWNQWLYSSARHRFVFGWDSACGAPLSHAGESAMKSVRGHLGYTGTAFWLDPPTQQYGILLTNRVCPQANDIIRKSVQKLRSA